MGDEVWTARKIGEFAKRSKVVNAEGAQLPPLSITKDRGVILQSEKYKKQIATDLRKYVIARRGQFAFDPMSLYYGAIGRVASMEIGLVSPDYVVFDVDDTVDKTFLNYLLRSPRQVAEYEAVAETGNSFGKRRRVYWSVLEQLELRVPPLDEQRRIAAILSGVDEAIETTQAVIDALQVVKKAMTVELLTRGMPGRHTRFKQTEVGTIPNDWRVESLRDVAEVSYGLTVNSQRRASNSRRPYLTVANLQEGGFDLTAVKEIGLVPGDERHELRDGDILLVEGNANPNRLGQAAVWRSAIPGALHQNHLIRLRCARHIVDPLWVALAIAGDAGRAYIKDHAKTSSGLHTINSTVVGGMPIPVPSPDEQHAIVLVVAAIDERITQERRKREALTILKLALTSSLLTGELRVIPEQEVE